MNKNIQIALGIIVLVLIGWYFVGQNTEPQTNEPIKIGFIGALSGEAAPYGQTQLNSINLALKEINETRQQKIEIIVEDGKCAGKDAITAAQKLVNIDKVKIILGFSCSSELLSAAPITELEKVITFSSAASNPQISDLGEYIFRNCPSDLDWVPYVSETIYKDGFNKLAILSENTDYAMGVKDIIKDIFIKKTGEVVADELYEENGKDYKSQITKIKNSNPDVIFLSPQSNVSAGLAAKQIREMGINVPIYSTYVWTSEEAIEVAGNASENIYFFDTPIIREDNIKGKNFLDNYNLNYGAPAHDFIAALSYDTMYIIEGGLNKCSENTDCLKDYLYSVKKYKGTVGEYGFNEKGDMTEIDFVKKQIINGEPVIIE